MPGVSTESSARALFQEPESHVACVALHPQLSVTSRERLNRVPDTLYYSALLGAGSSDVNQLTQWMVPSDDTASHGTSNDHEGMKARPWVFSSGDPWTGATVFYVGSRLPLERARESRPPSQSNQSQIQLALEEFATGVEGASRPAGTIVDTARRVAEAARDTVDPEISVDVDGALSFDLRLANGWLVLAELDPDGSLDASIYDQNGHLVKRLPRATEAALIDSFFA